MKRGDKKPKMTFFAFLIVIVLSWYCMGHEREKLSYCINVIQPIGVLKAVQFALSFSLFPKCQLK